MSTITATATIPHWIGGAEAPAEADQRTAEVYDPALGKVSGHVALASLEVVDRAVEAARAAFASWSQTSLARRQTILFRFRQLLDTRKGELAEIVTAEHGKVLSDALGEIERGLEVVDFATGLAQHLKGQYAEQVSTGIDVHSTREPLGVSVVISPFNFPAMVPLWFYPIAIAAGNTVVLKPSEKDPSASLWIARLWAEAGLPEGVFNVVNGDKIAVDRLLEHPDVATVSFVGSTPVARYVYETGTRHGKRVQALGGAKNHMVVLGDAPVDAAADAAVGAAYGSAGERCMAISVLLTTDDVADELISAIEERIAAIKVGDGRRGTDMGPLVTREHRDRVAGYIGVAADDGASIVTDGRGIDVDGSPDGFWLGPTLIDRLPRTSRAYEDEIFGPVLAVIRVAGLDEALEIVNENSYANGAAIFTRSGGAARRFRREISAGMIGVNVPIPVPVATFSFGGAKASLFGDAKAYGAQGFQFFTVEKTTTTRWPEDAVAGVQLTFPHS